MRFAATHKFVSYLMVTTAFLVLALSGELATEVSVLTTVGIVASFFFDPQRRPWMAHRVYRWGWNLAMMALLFASVAGWLQGEALLSMGTRLLCGLLVAKLWSRHGNRDYLHAYILSFFMLVAGSILNNNLIYGVCFVFYVIFTTWTLSLFHLRREMEENYLLKHMPSKDGKTAESERVEVERILNSRRVVGKAFLLGTSLISVAIFIVSGTVFFLTPRIGLGIDLGLQRHGMTTSGFADRIELGGYGRIRDNPQIVVRVEVPSGKPERTLYLRGVTFDQYDRGRWARSRKIASQHFVRYMNYYVVGQGPETQNFARFKRAVAEGLRTEIYLEPMDTNVLFAPTRAMAVVPPEGLLPGSGGSFHLTAGPGGEIFSPDRKAGMRYTVYSDVQPPDPAALRRSPDLPPEHDPELEAYLDLPRSLPDRVRQLAQRITKDARGPHQKAQAILSYLHTNYRYTTQLNRNERYEPIEDFLFEQHQGHCEYFASAMAVMLRSVGVPSRSVNGYQGGEWNEYGRYLVVRQQNAHSWIEAYLPGMGWVTYDPTPPSGLPPGAETGAWSRLKQLADTMEMSWFKYVIEYDLRTQVKMAEGAYSWVNRHRGKQRGFGIRSRLRAAWTLLRARAPYAIGGLVALGGVGALAYVLWRARGGQRRVPIARTDRLLQKALGELRRRGYGQRPGETLQQMARRISDMQEPAGSPFTELVGRYYACRFGYDEVDLGEFRELTRRIEKAQRRPDPPPAKPADATKPAAARPAPPDGLLPPR